MSCRKIIKKLGVAEIAGACGVTESSVRSAFTKNEFPASWYAVLKMVCEGSGIECDTKFFAFKSKEDAA